MQWSALLIILFCSLATLFGQNNSPSILETYDSRFNFPDGYYVLRIQNKSPALQPNNDPYYYHSKQKIHLFSLQESLHERKLLYVFEGARKNIAQKILIQSPKSIFHCKNFSKRLYSIQEKRRMKKFSSYQFSYLDLAFLPLAKHYFIPSGVYKKEYPQDTRLPPEPPPLYQAPKGLKPFLLLSNYPYFKKEKQKNTLRYQYTYRKMELHLNKKTEIPFRMDYYRDNGQLYKSLYYKFGKLADKANQRALENFPIQLRMKDLDQDIETRLEFEYWDSSKKPSRALFQIKGIFCQ